MDDSGICPAATDQRFHGIHRGTNAGRACWAVAGTLRTGKISCTFAQQRDTCGTCDFYKIVKDEEKKNLAPAIALLSILD